MVLDRQEVQMKQLADGTLERESGVRPGSIGDSMADTSRMVHLIGLTLNLDLEDMQDYTKILLNFRTAKGYVRHPDAPAVDAVGDSWREDDTPTDQCMPWFLGIPDKYAAAEMKQRIKANWWRTGDNNFVSPVFFALLTSSKIMLSIFLFIQSLFFFMPLRWSDAKKKFETTADMSCDYLNWMHAAVYGYSWGSCLISSKRMMDRVKHYHKDEPNSQWIVNLYQPVADKYLT
jgi:hypothetical protein